MFKTTMMALCLLATPAFAGLLFNYAQLATKDLEQMSNIVQGKIKESQKAGGDRVVPLKEALQAVFSRPNDDDMIEKLISPLKSALDEHEAWEPAIKKLTTEAIGALKNPRAFKPVVQVTYLVFLEGVMSELKPKASSPFEKRLLTTIRDAKIEITKEAKAERVLRVMKESRSPSEIAGEILKDLENRPPAIPASESVTVSPIVAPSPSPAPDETTKTKTP